MHSQGMREAWSKHMNGGYMITRLSKTFNPHLFPRATSQTGIQISFHTVTIIHQLPNTNQVSDYSIVHIVVR